MGLIPGFQHDIFISYAHNDNKTLHGWVNVFREKLKNLLMQHLGEKNLDIWLDTDKIDGSTDFDQSIREGIKNSAILICITSPSYYNSPNCIDELSLFYSKAEKEKIGLMVGSNRLRIVNVLLFNVHKDNWPKQLQGRTGFHFYKKKLKDSLGTPLKPTSKEFDEELENLRDAIFGLINAIKIKPEKVKTRKWLVPAILVTILLTCGIIGAKVLGSAQHVSNKEIRESLVGLSRLENADSLECQKAIDSIKSAYFAKEFVAYEDGNAFTGIKYLKRAINMGKNTSKIRVDSCAFDSKGKITKIYASTTQYDNPYFKQ